MGSQAAYKLPQDFEQALEAPPTPVATPTLVTAPAPASTTRIHLWDLPLRIFHWSLVLAVTTAIVTAKLGGDWMPVHGKAGLTIIGLVAFRLVWGLIGSKHARFISFAPTPAKVIAYLKGQWRGVGHNPLGAFSVFALLGLLAVQAGSGLFSNDDIAFTGPLFDLVDESLAGWFTGWHRQFANVLYVLLGLHVLAIVFYVRVKKDNLVKPMVTGWKDVPVDHAPVNTPAAPRSNTAVFATTFALALGVALTTVYAVTGAPFKPGSTAPTATQADAADASTSAEPSANTSNAATPTSSTKPAAAPAW